MVSNQETSGSQKVKVRIGRSMGMATAVAMGSLVTVGMVVYFLLGSIYSIAGTDTPTAYALMLFFFLPVALAIAERASVTPGKGGIFNLSRSSGSVPLAFTTGWLLIGGLVSTAALFAWEGATAVAEIFSLFFQIEIPGSYTAVALILVTLLFTQSRALGIWKRRRTIVTFSIILVLILIFSAWFLPLEIPSAWVYLPSANLLLTLPYLAVSLWGMHFVLDRRDAIRRPRQQIFYALYIPIVIGGIIGALAAASLILFPSLTYLKTLPLFTLANQIHPLLAFAVLLVMFFIGLFGLSESLGSLLRLTSAMENDGFLPARLKLKWISIKRGLYTYLLFAIIGSILAFFIQLENLFIQATSTILLAITLVSIQDIFRTNPRLEENRQPKLPFHPLIPGMSAAIGITFFITMGINAVFTITPLVLLGILMYITYARNGAVEVRRRDEMVAGAMMPVKKTNYRVMVALSDPNKADSLIRLGSKIAEAKKGVLIVLRVAPLINDDEVDQENAEIEWENLNDLVKQQEDISIPMTPVIRMAQDAATGILTTIWEEKIDLIVFGWPGDQSVSFRESDGTIQQIVRKAQCEVVILNGLWPSSVNQVLVPVISAGHSTAALALGQALIPEDNAESQVVALRTMPIKPTEEKRHQAEQQLYATKSKLENQRGISLKVVDARSKKEGILNTVEGYDALILGLSDEGFLAETDFSGLPVDIAQETESPTLLIKRQEKLQRYWLRRSWDILSDILPKLSPKRRAVVGNDMRQNAKADIDFYVLIVLAASIALFGLLQNSGAVVIGAMLVAPLMSPILAMSHSIVRGQLKIFRQATESTLNGVVMAITVGALLTLALVAIGIPIPPTNEILARTQPNFIDLLVAIASGAAAAYAISRSEVSAALPGVAIAAALVPPLAVVGYGLGTAHFDYASGALLLFLTNLAAIILTAAVVFLLLGIRPPAREGREDQARFGLQMAVVAMVLIAIPLFATTQISATQAGRAEQINIILEQYWPPYQAEVGNIEITDALREEMIVSFIIFDYAGVVTEQSLAELQSTLSKSMDKKVFLQSRIVDAQSKNYDEADAARQLSRTPTPTGTATPTATQTKAPTNTPRPTVTPSTTATLDTIPTYTLEADVIPIDILATPEP